MGDNRKERDANAVARDDAPNQQPLTEVDVAPSKSTKAPAFQFYPAEFLASHKVSRMPNVERGAYITLLCRCWLDNGLPTDLVELADLANMKSEPFERMWKTGRIGRCFIERGGKFHNERLDVERKKQAEYRRRQAENGSKGGRPTKSGGEATNNPPVDDRKPLISSSLSSSDLDSTQLQPIARRRRMDAAMEFESGVYVPQRTYDDFAALHPGEDLPSWFISVASSWLGRATGADMFKFWKARHDETWPPERPSQQPSSKPKPAWYNPTGAVKS